MNRGNRYAGIDEAAVRKIRFQAHILSRGPEFGDWDREDLEQEMMCDLLRRLRNFDHERAGLGTFIDRVVDHCAMSLREKARTGKRGFGQQKIDFDTRSIGENGLSDPDWSGCTPNPAGDLDLTIDIDALIAGLPKELRRICQLLKFDSVVGVCRQAGIPRATLYRRLAVIREHFAQAGFDKKSVAA